jgi:hypothetical protein
MNNPFLSAQNPVGRKELWFDPYDKNAGICNTDAVAPKPSAHEISATNKFHKK